MDRAIEKQKQLYLSLWDMADWILKTFNPCGWDTGKTRCLQGPPQECGCCRGCKHLSPTGCTVKSLSCKVWLCSKAHWNDTRSSKALQVIKSIAMKNDIFMDNRTSMEEVFKYKPTIIVFR